MTTKQIINGALSDTVIKIIISISSVLGTSLIIWLVVTFKDIVQNADKVPMLEKNTNMHNKWMLKHDSLKVIEKIQHEQYIREELKRHSEDSIFNAKMWGLMKNLYKEVNVTLELVEAKYQPINQLVNPPETAHENKVETTEGNLYDQNLLEYIFKRDSCLVKK